MNSDLIKFLLVVIASMGELTVAQAQSTQNMLLYATINQCEGKDASNYTWVQTFTIDSTCDISQTNGQITLIQIQTNNQKNANGLQLLAQSQYPAGAYQQIEQLNLVIGGSLQGKYVYIKTIILMNSYLKKCSSILGYSYLSSKSFSLLISDYLNLNVLISPTGAYDAFKKGCTTVCSGQGYIL